MRVPASFQVNPIELCEKAEKIRAIFILKIHENLFQNQFISGEASAEGISLQLIAVECLKSQKEERKKRAELNLLNRYFQTKFQPYF